MKTKLAEEVRSLAVQTAGECLREHVPGVARDQALLVVDRRMRSLPDVRAVAGQLFDEKMRTSPDLSRKVRDEATKVVTKALEAVPSMENVDDAIRRSPHVAQLAREEAKEVAAAETKRQILAEYEMSIFALIREIAQESVETLVRSYAEPAIRNGALPRLLEVSVGGAPSRSVDGDTHRGLPDLLVALGAGCHVLLVGPAGTGKSTMAKQAAQALGRPFHALSVGPTTPTSKMFGYRDAGGTYHRTPLRDAYEHGGLMLLDELDNGHPGLLAELNQALSLDVCAFPDGMIERHERFRLVATANTYGHGGDRQYVGRQALDAATLDRFVVIDVPVDEDMERRIAFAHAPSARDATSELLHEIRELRRVAADKKLPVMFSPRVSVHAARLVEAGAEIATVRRWCIVRGLSEAHRQALGIEESS